MKLTFSMALILSVAATAASADFSARFVEGAPKDTFRLQNGGVDCIDGPLSVEFDLTGSAGKLIFDVTEQGAGVEVFQPFELVAGKDKVVSASPVADGDKALRLDLSALPAGAEVAFTIDVDDTIGAREITVGRSEIVGATVTLTAGDTEARAVFDETATAQINWPDCPA